MTTIATDGRTIAADGLRTGGQERTALNEKKIRIVNGTIYAFTGTAKFYAPAIEWHQAGCEGLPPRSGEGKGDDAWSLLVVRPEGIERFTADDGKFSETYPYPQAFGSGCEYALAALHLGHTPREAVEVAAKLNVYTGGEIMVVDIAAVMAGASAAANVVLLKG